MIFKILSAPFRPLDEVNTFRPRRRSDEQQQPKPVDRLPFKQTDL